MHSIPNLLTYVSPIIAHRGASALAPENTLAAFRKAHAIGAKWVEFDVMLSACGEAVVIHDETLDRTTNGTGRVCDHSYAELQTLDAGSWFGSAYAGEKIPTLAQVLRVLLECKLTPNIEIKPSQGMEEKTVKKVLEVVEQCWPSDVAPPLISSFSTIVQFFVRKYSPTGLLACLMHEWQPDWKTTCDELHCIAMDVNHAILSQARVSEIRATNRLLLSYTVDDPVHARELFSWGVNAVFSNCPEEMHVFLRL